MHPNIAYITLQVFFVDATAMGASVPRLRTDVVVSGRVSRVFGAGAGAFGAGFTVTFFTKYELFSCYHKISVRRERFVKHGFPILAIATTDCVPFRDHLH